MTLTAFNRKRREEAARRQAIIVKPAKTAEPTPPTAEELAAQAAAEYGKHVRKLNKAGLVELAEQRGVETAGLNKDQLVEALVTIGPAQEPADESGDETDGADSGEQPSSETGSQESE